MGVVAGRGRKNYWKYDKSSIRLSLYLLSLLGAFSHVSSDRMLDRDTGTRCVGLSELDQVEDPQA